MKIIMKNNVKTFQKIMKPLLKANRFKYDKANRFKYDKKVHSVMEGGRIIIVKDLSSNKTIFKKNEEKIVRPASLTKIMTSILAIESGKMNDVVTITKPMIDVEPTKLD